MEGERGDFLHSFIQFVQSIPETFYPHWLPSNNHLLSGSVGEDGRGPNVSADLCTISDGGAKMEAVSVDSPECPHLSLCRQCVAVPWQNPAGVHVNTQPSWRAESNIWASWFQCRDQTSVKTSAPPPEQTLPRCVGVGSRLVGFSSLERPISKSKCWSLSLVTPLLDWTTHIRTSLQGSPKNTHLTCDSFFFVHWNHSTYKEWCHFFWVKVGSWRSEILEVVNGAIALILYQLM